MWRSDHGLSPPVWSTTPSWKRRAISRSASASRRLHNVRRLSTAAHAPKCLSNGAGLAGAEKDGSVMTTPGQESPTDKDGTRRKDAQRPCASHRYRIVTGWASVRVADLLIDLKAAQAIEPMLRVLAELDFEDTLFNRLSRVSGGSENGKELTVFHATACSCGLIRRVERTLPAHVHPHESTPARPAAVSC